MAVEKMGCTPRELLARLTSAEASELMAYFILTERERKPGGTR